MAFVTTEVGGGDVVEVVGDAGVEIVIWGWGLLVAYLTTKVTDAG